MFDIICVLHCLVNKSQKVVRVLLPDQAFENFGTLIN